MAAKRNISVPIAVTYNVPLERIGDLLVSAFEGGSTHWYFIADTYYPAKVEFSVMGENSLCRHPADAVLNEGGYVLVRSVGESGEIGDEINGQTEWRLDLEACRRALQMMADGKWKGSDECNRPARFWEAFINESDDAETADVFLQLALFGEIAYG